MADEAAILTGEFAKQVERTVRIVLQETRNPNQQRGRYGQRRHRHHQGYLSETLLPLGETDTEPPTADFTIWKVNHEDLTLYSTGKVIEVVNRQCDLTLVPADLIRVENIDGEWRPYVWEDAASCSESSEESESESESDDSDSDPDPSGSTGSASSVSTSVSVFASSSISLSISSGSSCTGDLCYCLLPIRTQVDHDDWAVYANNEKVDSGIEDHEAIDEGVDSSDDAATAIRPEQSSGDGKEGFDLALPGGGVAPAEWTHIDSVTARMRARLLPHPDPTDGIPFSRTVEVLIGDDSEGEEAGNCTFVVDSPSYQTYEQAPTPNLVTLPKLISEGISYDEWFMTEFIEADEEPDNPMNNFHNVEISAIEICITGH